MPTLSFVLSGLLVGAGAIYGYLSYSQKIEESKAKIEESKKLVYIAKKSSLNSSSVAKDDINNTTISISLDDGKISNFLAKDENLTKMDSKLLDKLQLAMQKAVLDQGVENPTCQTLSATGYITEEECEQLKNKELQTYKVTSDEIKLPDNSILSQDTKNNLDLIKNIQTSKNSDLLSKKNIDSFHKQLEDSKEVEKVVQNISDSKYFEKIASKYITKEKTIINDRLVKTFEKTSQKFILDQRKDDKNQKDNKNSYKNISDLLSKYKSKKTKSEDETSSKLSYLEDQKYKLLQEKNKLSDSIEQLKGELNQKTENSKKSHNPFDAMSKVASRVTNTIKRDLDKKVYQLKKVNKQIEDIDNQISKLKSNKQG